MLESELYPLLEDTAEAVFAVRESSEICFWNRGAEKLFGYTGERARGKSCFEVLHGRDSLGTEVCWDRLNVLNCHRNPVEIPAFDLQIRRADGSQLWVNLATFAHRNLRSGGCLLVHIARDISMQKHQEELIERFVAITKEIAVVMNPAAGAAPVSTLSDKEVRILRMLAAGDSSAVVLRRLRISSQTLRNHLHRINRKLRTHNRLEAVTHATLRKLI